MATKYGNGFIEFSSDGNTGTIGNPNTNSYAQIYCDGVNDGDNVIRMVGASSAKVELRGLSSGTSEDAVVTKAQLDTALLTGHKTRSSVYAASVSAMPTTGVTVDLSAGTITVASDQTINDLLGDEGLTVNDIQDPAYQEGKRYLFYHGLTAGNNKLNGIYTLTTVTSTTAFVLTRAFDFNVGDHYQPNTTVYVEAGSTHVGRTFGTSAILDRYLEESGANVRTTSGGTHAAGSTTITVDGTQNIPAPTPTNVYTSAPLSVHVGQAVQIKNFWYRVTTAPNDTKTFVITPGLREAVEDGYPIRLGLALISDTGDTDDSTSNRIDSASNTWTQVYGGSGGSTDLNSLTAGTVDVAQDSYGFIDADDNSSKKATISTLVSAISGTGLTATDGVMAVNIGGATEMTEAIVDTDELLISDAGTVKRTDMSLVATYVQGQNSALTMGEGLKSTEQIATTSSALSLGDDDYYRLLFVSSTGNMNKGTIASVSGDTITLSNAIGEKPASNSYLVVIKHAADENHAIVPGISGMLIVDGSGPDNYDATGGVVTLNVGHGIIEAEKAEYTWFSFDSAVTALNAYYDLTADTSGTTAYGLLSDNSVDVTSSANVVVLTTGYTSGASVTKVTITQPAYLTYDSGRAVSTTLDLTDTTDVGADLESADRFLIYDNSAGAIRRTDASRITTLVQAGAQPLSIGTGLTSGGYSLTANASVSIGSAEAVLRFVTVSGGSITTFGVSALSYSDINQFTLTETGFDASNAFIVVMYSPSGSEETVRTTMTTLTYNVSPSSDGEWNGNSGGTVQIDNHGITAETDQDHVAYIFFTSGTPSLVDDTFAIDNPVNNSSTITGDYTGSTELSTAIIIGGTNLVIGAPDLYSAGNNVTAVTVATSPSKFTYTTGTNRTLALDLNSLEAAVVDPANDSIAIIDSDGTSKKESLADLLTLIAGDNLSYSSGQLNATGGGSLDIGSLAAETSCAEGDLFVFEDVDESSGTNNQITYANLRDGIFGSISGDATVAAGGALTIQANSVELSMMATQAAYSVLANATSNIAVPSAVPATSAGSLLHRPYTGDVAFSQTPELVSLKLAVAAASANALTIDSANQSGTGTITLNTASSGTGTIDFATTGKTLTINQTCNIDQDLQMTAAVTFESVTTSSDVMLKKNIGTIADGLGVIKQIRPVEWDWKSNDERSSGVVAQQLEEILPHLVKTGAHKSVNYNGLHGYLISAIQQLSAELDELKSAKKGSPNSVTSSRRYNFRKR
jgi:hypothetical protein